MYCFWINNTANNLIEYLLEKDGIYLVKFLKICTLTEILTFLTVRFKRWPRGMFLTGYMANLGKL